MTDEAEAVLFDMDGTLIDSQQNAIRSVQKGLESLDEELSESVPVPSKERITSLIGVPSDQYFREILPDHLRKYREQVEDRIGQFEREGIKEGRVPFYAGMQRILEALTHSSVSTGLVTNAGRAYFETHRENLNLDRYFDLLYCVDDSPRKEKQELVQRFLEKKDHPETVMVGDRKYDLEAARRHDVPFIAVKWGYGDSQELDTVDWTVDEPEELADLLSIDVDLNEEKVS